MDELLIRQAPHSPEAEQAVLGSMLIDPDCIKDVMDKLQPEDFYLRQNREIFETIYSMFLYSKPIDGVTVAGEMERSGLYTDDTRGYLVQLMEVTPTSANVMEYVKIVREKALLRAVASAAADIKPGNALPLEFIPVGTLVHAVELQPGKGAAIARSAGTSIQLMGKEGDYAILRMPSSEMRRVLVTCRATVGEVGNAEHGNIKIGKAGRNRWKGIRPSVRGTVMNPVDHPHGGGEGKNKSSGRHPVTPWGVSTKGHRTRNPKKASTRLIIRRRKK